MISSLLGKGWWILFGMVLAGGCSSMPPLEQQKRLVEEGMLPVRQLTAPAFVSVWGKPTYHHSEYSQFFVMRDHSMVPHFRVPLGEAPSGWEGNADAGEGVYFAYPDHGWLLVFIDEVLVYREELKAEELRALGKAWQHEERFKTRLDQVPSP